MLEKGAVEIPLPRELAATVQETLRLDAGGKIGPVRIVATPEPPPAAEVTDQTSLRPPPPPPAFVPPSTWEQREYPLAEGLLVPPDQSALLLVETQQPGETRKKNLSGADAVITFNFVLDLARYLAESYWPQGSHMSAARGPASTATVSGINQRYGAELTGLASFRAKGERRDYYRERALVLNYAFMPSMLQALARLYADRFAASLAEEGRGQRRLLAGQNAYMNDEDVAGMLRFYAGYSRAIGFGLLAYAEHPGAADAVRRLREAESNGFRAAETAQQARYTLENALEEEQRDNIRTARAHVEKADKEYRLAVLELQRRKEEVTAFMARSRASTAKILDEAELLYLASWAARRGPRAAEALRAAAKSAEFAAEVLREKAEEILPSLNSKRDGVEN
jgi:hypothetical protein